MDVEVVINVLKLKTILFKNENKNKLFPKIYGPPYVGFKYSINIFFM
jgi:hypothetical protein